MFCANMDGFGSILRINVSEFHLLGSFACRALQCRFCEKNNGPRIRRVTGGFTARRWERRGFGLLDHKGVVDGVEGFVGVRLVDEHGNLDFACADHLDIDVRFA